MKKLFPIHIKNFEQTDIEMVKKKLEGYLLALNASRIGTWEWNRSDNSFQVDDSVPSLFGYIRVRQLNSIPSFINYIHDEDVDKARKYLKSLLNYDTDYCSFEARIKCRNGEWKWAFINGQIIALSEYKPIKVVGTIQDINEKKMLEEKFHQGEKLKAIGKLAGGIAHDFNNQLTCIKGYAMLLKPTLGKEKQKQYLDNIICACNNSADLIRKLLDFSRKGRNHSDFLNIHQLLDETTEILRHTLNREISIQIDYQANNSTIIGDRIQLQNAFLNLALNARDAMPSGGRIKITTENQLIDTKSRDKTKKMYLLIKFKDSGEGIPKENINRIFQPFFTTKNKGEGTGMGLPAVYGTVKSHNGSIWVESQVKRGSTFNILFPVSING